MIVGDTGWTFGLVWHVAPDGKQLTWYRSVGAVPALLKGRNEDFDYHFGEGAAGKAWATKDVWSSFPVRGRRRAWPPGQR